MTKNGRKIAELGPGDWLGEIALITDSPRTATVTATSPVDLLVITDRRFRTVVETMPSIALKVLLVDRRAALARRAQLVRKTGSPLARSFRSREDP